MQYSGITSGYNYPYNSGSSGIFSGECREAASGDFKIVGYEFIQNNCQTLRDRLQTKPISTAITGLPLQFYSSGVYTSCPTNPILDHAVLIVGFDNTKGWRIKNSWGSGWGESGYAWITPNSSKNCGICLQAFVPTI